MNRIHKIVLSLLLLVSFAASAQNIPAKPNPPRLVNDFAGVLSASEAQQLEQKLVSYDDSTSNQVVIVTIKTLNDYPIEEYALKLFREWGIGNKKTNNGVLILAAMDDRKIRIQTGYGLEGAIPDITANHIIENDIKPNFKSGDYFDGFDQASQSIIKAAAGEYKAPEGYGRRQGRNSGKTIGIIVFVIIIIIISFIRRGGGGGGLMSRRGSTDWVTPFIIGSMLGRGSGGGGGGSDWGGGGGGGGFGGFGGGSSGGGGASGSW